VRIIIIIIIIITIIIIIIIIIMMVLGLGAIMDLKVGGQFDRGTSGGQVRTESG
jgi:hypothetical protein